MNPAVLSSQTSVYITFMASFMILVLFAGLAILWLIDGKIKQEVALHAIVSVLVAWLFSEMIKGLFPTLRPYQINGKLPVTFTLMHSSGSFPSSHTAVAFAIATSVWLHDKKIGAVFMFGAVLVAIGRVMSNVHYPTDVLGGAIIGFLVSYTMDRVHMHTLLRKLK